MQPIPKADESIRWEDGMQANNSGSNNGTGGGEGLPQGSGNSRALEQEDMQGQSGQAAASVAGIAQDDKAARKLEARIGYHLCKVTECENMANDLLKKAQRHKLLARRLGKRKSEVLTFRLL